MIINVDTNTNVYRFRIRLGDPFSVQRADTNLPVLMRVKMQFARQLLTFNYPVNFQESRVGGKTGLDLSSA